MFHRVFFEGGSASVYLQKCRTGDKMGVGVIFNEEAHPMFFFTKNGKKVNLR